MKSLFIIICASIFFVSCKSGTADQQATESDTTNANINYAWVASLNDTTGKMELKKSEATAIDSLSPASIINFINGKDTNIHLDLTKISNDTIYVKIPNATHLTQQMGSSGAELYMAGVIYNLTELNGIRYVNFDFEEGDHAGPGTYNRDSFKDQ